ncbi:hypothetical protein B0T26DRAFT_751993 [Lasiosphaeria miniovina]|uniref:Uncharacterized protein n=1 Tax=Lasiosphaeria miniovina TaxID=1954250 RepID=A0AA40E0C0_9PEZI|nr:uncharacterized protein B0T26DRAFT_751993 [Lasiosphaeria miniovina]KAK0718008.1 hypothetical protein B0T26DRAFT_751993 [Lasiosphaeria miniovina]
MSGPVATMHVCSNFKRFCSSLQDLVSFRRRKDLRRQLQISEPFNFRKEDTVIPGLTENEITVMREKAAASCLGIADLLYYDTASMSLSLPLPSPRLRTTPDVPDYCHSSSGGGGGSLRGVWTPQQPLSAVAAMIARPVAAAATARPPTRLTSSASAASSRACSNRSLYRARRALFAASTSTNATLAISPASSTAMSPSSSSSSSSCFGRDPLNDLDLDLDLAAPGSPVSPLSPRSSSRSAWGRLVGVAI